MFIVMLKDVGMRVRKIKQTRYSRSVQIGRNDGMQQLKGDVGLQGVITAYDIM